MTMEDSTVTINDLVSTLNEVKLSPKRRDGNTTRIINNAIEQLFNGKKVVVKDYPENYSLERSELLFKRILKRIKSEHPQAMSFIKREIVDNFIVLYLNSDGK